MVARRDQGALAKKKAELEGVLVPLRIEGRRHEEDGDEELNGSTTPPPESKPTAVKELSREELERLAMEVDEKEALEKLSVRVKEVEGCPGELSKLRVKLVRSGEEVEQ